MGEDDQTLVSKRIQLLTLRIFVMKTEAVWFHGGTRTGPQSPEELHGEEVQVPVGDHIKYLGLTLNNRWHFEWHFKTLAAHLDRAAVALVRLLPNIRGPDARHRSIYPAVIRSKLARVWLRLAIRLARGYRTPRTMLPRRSRDLLAAIEASDNVRRKGGDNPPTREEAAEKKKRSKRIILDALRTRRQ